MVVDEFAEVVDEGGDVPRVQQVHVNFNQKDDYLHRGSLGFVAMHVPFDVFSLRPQSFQEQSRQGGWSEVFRL